MDGLAPPPPDEHRGPPSGDSAALGNRIPSTDPFVANVDNTTLNGATSDVDGGGSPVTRILEVPPCPHCRTPRSLVDTFCGECGFIFPQIDNDYAVFDLTESRLVRGRYRLHDLIGERGKVERFEAIDLKGSTHARLPVIVLRQPISDVEAKLAIVNHQPETSDSTVDEAHALPELAALPLTAHVRDLPAFIWPGVEWERVILERAEHLSLPRVLDHFQDNGYVYLVVESPPGRPLWEAWRDRSLPASHRFEWLIQLAEALHSLHEAGAMLGALRPEIVSITPTGQAVIADLRDLLPMPLPKDATVAANFYTAPELLLKPETADPRADLYGFGGLLYALTLGRDITESDFAPDGFPRPFLQRFPDAHPMLGRLVSKTYCPDPNYRFPSDPGDTTAGIEELIQGIDAYRRNVSRLRLEVSAWTTTGIARAGNEDALAVHHCLEGRLEDGDESALLILADGMGGVESGEIAAAIAVQTARKFLLEEPPFCGVNQSATPVLRGRASQRLLDAAVEELENYSELGATVDVPSPLVWPGSLMLDVKARESPLRNEAAHEERVMAAIREANHQVYQAASHGLGDRGMGCTLEVVLIDGSTCVIGHVGDSRTYLISEGRMAQVTRDQTLVTRLVELGQITSEQAETHPRRSELQQAVGGRPEVQPDTYIRSLAPGNWLIVCSDGLTGQLRPELIQEIVESAQTAEQAARRLVNRCNLEGALDNVSVIVLRAT